MARPSHSGHPIACGSQVGVDGKPANVLVMVSVQESEVLTAVPTMPVAADPYGPVLYIDMFNHVGTVVGTGIGSDVMTGHSAACLRNAM